MNKNVPLVSCDSNVLVLSPQVTVYSGYLLLSTYSCGIRILSAKEYGVRPSPEHNYWSCGMEFQKLFSTRCVHWAVADPRGGGQSTFPPLEPSNTILLGRGLAV